MKLKRSYGLFLGIVFICFIVGAISWALGAMVHHNIPIYLFVISGVVLIVLLSEVPIPLETKKEPFRALLSLGIFLTLMLPVIIALGTGNTSGTITMSILLIITILRVSATTVFEYSSE